jgi:hypothetical protein
MLRIITCAVALLFLSTTAFANGSQLLDAILGHFATFRWLQGDITIGDILVLSLIEIGLFIGIRTSNDNRQNSYQQPQYHVPFATPLASQLSSRSLAVTDSPSPDTDRRPSSADHQPPQPAASTLPDNPPAMPQQPPQFETPHTPSITDPSEGIVLKIKKTTKQGLTGIIYMIDARIDASPAIRSVIATHRLGGRLVYESDKRQQYLQMAQVRANQSRSRVPLLASAEEQFKGTASTFFRLGQAVYNRARAALALKITVDKLLLGVHVECKNVDELGEAESAIIAAKHNLEGYLEELATFDGREQIY